LLKFVWLDTVIKLVGIHQCQLTGVLQYTFCLEGKYTEKLWTIINDGSDAITHVFEITLVNTIESFKTVPGVLTNISSRDHFQRNILRVDTNQYHSISPSHQSNDHVFTFVARKICPSALEYSYILSPSDKIETPIDKTRQATLKERVNVYVKLLQNFLRILFNSRYQSCKNEKTQI
jgi:hypothetical protein